MGQGLLAKSVSLCSSTGLGEGLLSRGDSICHHTDRKDVASEKLLSDSVRPEHGQNMARRQEIA